MRAILALLFATVLAATAEPRGPVSKLAQVGYARQLAAEGILSVHPTLLLVTDDAGAPDVLTQVEKAG